ncbi:hypothetical protein ACFX13_042387 [Malus domestica]|uniref:Uncharacterized protein n=1 Tax=Malus domestica TaxID=3750 RepID=A0A498JGV7_MALDO|nr:hypothetical protein DVH24_024464 [Malus domestica]
MKGSHEKSKAKLLGPIDQEAQGMRSLGWNTAEHKRAIAGRCHALTADQQEHVEIVFKERSTQMSIA